MSNPHEWHSEKEMQSDAMAIGVAALLDDPESTHAVFKGLDRPQLVALAWTLACFWINTVENDMGAETLEALRRAAVAIADDDVA
jgi:hypothetical protein